MIKRKKLTLISLIVLALCSFSLVFAGFFGAGATETYHKSDVLVANSGVKSIQTGVEFLEQYHVNNSNCKDENMLVGKSTSGIGVYSNGGTIDFSYKNAINFADKTAKDCLVEIYPLFGSNYAKIVDIQITLTDTEDPSNTVAVHYDDAYDGLAIYARALYKGKDIAYNGNGFIWNGARGIWLQNCGYASYHLDSKQNAINWEKGEISPFNVHLDYETKVLSSSYYSSYGVYVQKDILDLDEPNHVGIGYEWNGFTNDTAYLSVLVTFSEAVTDNRPGGVIVKSIDGVNVDGDFTASEEMPLPKITPATVKEYGETLPYGAVGVDYKIPSVFAYDWFFGIADDSDVSYVIEKFDGTDYVETSFTGGNGGVNKFTEAGEYRIKYSVSNDVKTATKHLNFEVKPELAPIIVGQVEAYKTPVLDEYFYIPETVVSGGSGNLVKTETLYFNGQQITLNNNRDVLIDKAGVLSLKVECNGYTGDTYVKYFPVEVADGIIISVGNMPKAIMGNNAETIVLPTATAIATATGEKVDVTVTADGVAVGADGAIKTEKTEGTITVVYTAETVSKEYKIQVIESETRNQKPSDFVIKNGNVTVTDADGGILVETSENGAGITWAFPAVTEYGSSKMNVVLSQASSKLDFDYIDVVLSDASEKQKDCYIRIYKDNLLAYSTEETSVKVNGAEEIYTVKGSIGNEGGSIRLSIDGNGLYNSSGNLVCDFSADYDAELSYISIIFGGVDGVAAIRVDTIGNQLLGYDTTYGWSEASAVLSFNNRLAVATVLPLGKTFFIPACRVYDLTSNSGRVTVSVTAPDGETRIIDRANTDKELSFTPTELGEYTISYAIMDGYGNPARSTYVVQVVDQVNPTLTVNAKLKSEIKLGATVTLPEATATDAVDGACDVIILVRYLDTYGLVVAKDGKYTFDKAGKYQVIYQTHDLSYNYTQQIFTVTVTED
ncbi:MAG: hypothetical protein IKA11_04580 [Clostridia bacterium]|nr:hypothetical protein [Clostridia bacterium]